MKIFKKSDSTREYILAKDESGSWKVRFGAQLLDVGINDRRIAQALIDSHKSRSSKPLDSLIEVLNEHLRKFQNDFTKEGSENYERVKNLISNAESTLNMFLKTCP